MGNLTRAEFESLWERLYEEKTSIDFPSQEQLDRDVELDVLQFYQRLDQDDRRTAQSMLAEWLLNGTPEQRARAELLLLSSDDPSAVSVLRSTLESAREAWLSGNQDDRARVERIIAVLARPLGNASSVAFMGTLVYAVPELVPLLQVHLGDLGGVLLPHVLISDVGRWAQQEAISGRTSAASPLVLALDRLEEAFATGVEEISELVAVSFLEEIPRPGEPGAQLRELVGSYLAEQLRVIG